jgi:hypothetical protein
MMAVAALVAWVLTACIGVYMLRTWVARGGLRRQRATGVGVPPAVVFGHASAALTGLAIWAGFVKTNWEPLAWLGVVLITAAIALGVCTVTLWTPYPVLVPVQEDPGRQVPARGVPGGWVPPKGGPGGWVPPKGGPGGWVPPEGGEEEEAGGSGPSGSGVSPGAGVPREDLVTDEMIASLLADPFPARRRSRLRLLPVIPVVHGFGALTTFMLAVLAAIGTLLGAF